MMQCCRRWCLRGSERDYLARLLRSSQPRPMFDHWSWAEQPVERRCYEPVDTEDPLSPLPLPWRQAHIDHQLVLIRLIRVEVESAVVKTHKNQHATPRRLPQERLPSNEDLTPDANISSLPRAAAMGFDAHWASRRLTSELVIDVPYSPCSRLSDELDQQQRFWSRIAAVTQHIELPLFITVIDSDEPISGDGHSPVDRSKLATVVLSRQYSSPFNSASSSSSVSSSSSSEDPASIPQIRALLFKTRHELFVTASARHFASLESSRSGDGPKFTQLFYESDAPDSLRLLESVMEQLNSKQGSRSLLSSLRLLWIRGSGALNRVCALTGDHRLASLYLIGLSGPATKLVDYPGLVHHLVLVGPTADRWGPCTLPLCDNLKETLARIDRLELVNWQLSSTLRVRESANRATDIRLVHCILHDSDGIVDDHADAMAEFMPRERRCNLVLRPMPSSWTRELKSVVSWVLHPTEESGFVHSRVRVLIVRLLAFALAAFLLSLLDWLIAVWCWSPVVSNLRGAIDWCLLLAGVVVLLYQSVTIWTQHPFISKLPGWNRIPQRRRDFVRESRRMALWVSVSTVLQSWELSPVWCVMLCTLGAKLLHALRSPCTRRKIDYRLLLSYSLRYLSLRWCQLSWFSISYQWMLLFWNTHRGFDFAGSPLLIERMRQHVLAPVRSIVTASWIDAALAAATPSLSSIPAVALMSVGLFGLQLKWREHL